MMEIIRDTIFFYFFVVLIFVASFFSLKEKGILDILENNMEKLLTIDDKDNEENRKKIFTIEENIKNELAITRIINICICILFALLAWAIIYYLFISYKKMQ